MEKDFEGYLNGKLTMLEAICEKCNLTSHVFVDLTNSWANCPNCNLKIYQLYCPKCESGFDISEGQKEIDLAGQRWYCGICKEYVAGLPEKQIKAYKNEEIPQEVWKKYKGDTKVSKNLFLLFLLSIVILGIVFLL